MLKTLSQLLQWFSRYGLLQAIRSLLVDNIALIIGHIIVFQQLLTHIVLRALAVVHSLLPGNPRCSLVSLPAFSVESNWLPIKQKCVTADLPVKEKNDWNRVTCLPERP